MKTGWIKYHIVFTPKYRRKIIYNELKADIRDIIKDLCKWKGIEIIEGHLMPDHIHLLISIPPKFSVSTVMGYLKGKSAMMIFERHSNLNDTIQRFLPVGSGGVRGYACQKLGLLCIVILLVRQRQGNAAGVVSETVIQY